MKSIKSVERALRRYAIRVISRLMHGRASSEARLPRWHEGPHRVLFLRYDRIGDMIVSTGLIRAIASSHATIELDVLASRENAPVVSEEPHVRRVLVFERWKPWTYPALVRRLRRARYDAVVDWKLAGPSLTTLVLMLASGARHRIGVSDRGIDSALTVVTPRFPESMHIIDQLAALAAPFGVDVGDTDWSPRIALSPTELASAERTWAEAGIRARERRVLVNVSAGKTFRRWPDERFVKVLQHARSREPRACLLVIGSPGERIRVDRIASESGATALHPATIRQAFGLVATADLILSPDTSIGHAAAAFKRPAIVMYGHGYEARWGLYRSPGRCVSSPGRELGALSAQAVIDVLDEVLQQLGSAVRDQKPKASFSPTPPHGTPYLAPAPAKWLVREKDAPG